MLEKIVKSRREDDIGISDNEIKFGEKMTSFLTSSKMMQTTSDEGSSAPVYIVVRGIDPTECFGRIIVSRTIISDHSCPSYLYDISEAL